MRTRSQARAEAAPSANRPPCLPLPTLSGIPSELLRECISAVLEDSGSIWQRQRKRLCTLQLVSKAFAAAASEVDADVLAIKRQKSAEAVMALLDRSAGKAETIKEVWLQACAGNEIIDRAQPAVLIELLKRFLHLERLHLLLPYTKSEQGKGLFEGPIFEGLLRACTSLPCIPNLRNLHISGDRDLQGIWDSTILNLQVHTMPSLMAACRSLGVLEIEDISQKRARAADKSMLGAMEQFEQLRTMHLPDLATLPSLLPATAPMAEEITILTSGEFPFTTSDLHFGGTAAIQRVYQTLSLHCKSLWLTGYWSSLRADVLPDTPITGVTFLATVGVYNMAYRVNRPLLAQLPDLKVVRYLRFESRQSQDVGNKDDEEEEREEREERMQNIDSIIQTWQPSIERFEMPRVLEGEKEEAKAIQAKCDAAGITLRWVNHEHAAIWPRHPFAGARGTFGVQDGFFI